jgi:hypothetical protein
MAGVGVAAGIDRETVVLLVSAQPEALWRTRLPEAGRIVLLRPLAEEEHHSSAWPVRPWPRAFWAW